MDGAEATIRQLEAQDVECVFGVCGDTSVGLYKAFATLDHDLTHVLARDERSAAYMADAYARLSGKPGIVEGPSGGGATYPLPGLAESTGSSIPVIALNTTIPVRYRGRGVLTELDQGALVDPITTWHASVDHPDLVARHLRQAFRHATTGRPGATHLSLPMDVLASETDAPILADPDTSSCPAYRPQPDPARVEAAAALIDEADKPVIVAGGGVHTSRAWIEVATFANQFGIPVAQTLTGRGCIGDGPFSIGVVGENGYREYANEIIGSADVVLLFGTAVESVWTEKWSNPAEGECAFVHIDVDPASIGRNYQPAVSIPADLRETVVALLDAVDREPAWAAESLNSLYQDWVKPYADRFDSDAFPVRPERMVADTQRILGDDAIILSDPGTACPYFAALYEFPRAGLQWITPRAHGALGYAIPGAIGAQVATPDSTVVAFTGDGSFGTVAGELETIARLNLPVTIVVVSNDAFSWIEAGQRGYADFSFGVDFKAVDHAAVAEAYGISGISVEDADGFTSALNEATSTREPYLIDLPVTPIATLDDVPVDWLAPASGSET